MHGKEILEKKDMDELVSVIVPVYNVYPYLDRCVQSIVNQTYTKIEILLIDDGSTDNSGKLCEVWEKRDSRIISIRTENRGVGAARNLGIERAQGKYIAFVDADDWIHECFIEKLQKEITQDNVDIVSCNVMFYYAVTNKYKEKKLRQKFSIIDEENKKDYLLYMPAYFCNKLFKADILEDEELRFPNCFYEDTALYPMIISKVRKIIHVEEILYYYWKDRNESTTNCLNRMFDIVKAMEYSLGYFQKQGLLDEYEGTLRKYFVSRVYRFYLQCGKNDKMKQELKEASEEILSRFFADWKIIWNIKAYIWGSFNARWIGWTLNGCNQSVGEHVCFNSFISQMLGKKLQCEILEENPFRYKMLSLDFTKGASEELTQMCCEGIKIVIMDLLEERYDILEVADDCYVTDSEALQKSGINLQIHNRIEIGSELHKKLWLQACNKWISVIENLEADVKVILLKIRLAKGYQKENHYILFEEQERIEQANIMIETMEKYLINNCTRIKFLEVEDLFVADAYDVRGYGCSAEYLDAKVYKKYEMGLVDYIRNEYNRSQNE